MTLASIGNNYIHGRGELRCGIIYILPIVALLISVAALVLVSHQAEQHYKTQTIKTRYFNISSLKSKNTQLKEGNVQIKDEWNVVKNFSTSTGHKGSHCTLELLNDNYNEINEHVRGIHVQKNALVLEYTGLYYIFSQVNIQSNQTVFVFLHRISPNRPQLSGVLLRGVKSHPKTTEIVFIGGVFSLSNQDIIEVCVSAESELSINNDNSFVGLFMLSSN